MYTKNAVQNPLSLNTSSTREQFKKLISAYEYFITKYTPSQIQRMKMHLG